MLTRSKSFALDQSWEGEGGGETNKRTNGERVPIAGGKTWGGYEGDVRGTDERGMVPDRGWENVRCR